MKPLRLALEWFLNPDHVPFLLGQADGLFAAEGIDLTLVEPAEHFDAFEAMRRGEVDVAITEPIHLVQDRAQGADLMGFARFLHTNGGVMARRDRGVRRPADLVGCRLQYPGAPGPGGPAILRTMIAADGGPADAPVVPVNNGFFHTDALIEDKADAATLVFYNFEVIEARHKGLDVSFFALKDWGVPDFCQLILVAREATLRERAAELDALIRVLRRGIDLIQQEPDRVRVLAMERLGYDPADPLNNAIYDATIGCFTHDLSMSAEYYERLAAWLAQTGQAPEGVDGPAGWTNALVT